MSDRREYVDLLLFQTWFQTHVASETDPALRGRARELRKLVLECERLDPQYLRAVKVLSTDKRPSKDREGRELVASIRSVVENPKWQTELDQQCKRNCVEQGAARALAHHVVTSTIFFFPESKKKLSHAPQMLSATLLDDIEAAKDLVAHRLAPMLAKLHLDPDKLAHAALVALGCTVKEAHNIIRG